MTQVSCISHPHRNLIEPSQHSKPYQTSYRLSLEFMMRTHLSKASASFRATWACEYTTSDEQVGSGEETCRRYSQTGTEKGIFGMQHGGMKQI